MDVPQKLVLEFLNTISGIPKTPSMLDVLIADSEELKNNILVFENGMPHYEIVVEAIVTEGDKLVIQSKFNGIHKGELFGYSASNKAVSLNTILFLHLENMKVVKYLFLFDFFAFLFQTDVANISREPDTEKVYHALSNYYFTN